VIVSRLADGGIAAVLNRCTHRGTTLTVESSGCAKRFTCPYHGWTFEPDGRLVGVPYPQNYADLDRERLGLGRLTVAEHRGFWFGTLATDPIHFDTWLGSARGPMDEIIDRHPGGAITVLPTPMTIEFAGNWKLSWDNAADGLHATFAHRSYNGLGRSTGIDTVLQRDPASTPMYARVLEHGHVVVDQRPGIPAGPWSTMRAMPLAEGLESDLRDNAGADSSSLLDLATGSMLNLSLFPSLLFVGNQLMVVESVAVDRTRLRLYLTVPADAPAEVTMLRLRVDEDFASFGNSDDFAMFERIQDGLGIPELPWIDMSRGLGSPTDRVDPDTGEVTGPITSEAAQRSYLAEWRRLMEAGA
jgi:phenylpropionate dioxygenase-like ring-hydroxylating dioxygenase large terminal subunit